MDESEIAQRQQQAAGDGAIDAGSLGNFRDRHGPVVGPEAFDDLQAARKAGNKGTAV
jgi:hypothetical protein